MIGPIMNRTPFGMPSFDPSKMDPKALMELSQLFQQLPPSELGRMQTLMHNMMAGHDVQKDMEEFERNLPPGFREKLMALIGGPGGLPSMMDTSEPIDVKPISGLSQGTAAEMDLHQARITILQAVAEGRMTPEQAEGLLFPN